MRNLKYRGFDLENKQWALRSTPERKDLIDRVREKLDATGRKVPRLHGVITDAALLELGLHALERELDQELSKINKEINARS